MEAIIFGHSHVWSVKRALASAKAVNNIKYNIILCGTKEFPGPLVNFNMNGEPNLNQALISALNQYEPNKETYLVSISQGNYYNQFGMYVGNRAFDIDISGLADLPEQPDLDIVPLGAVREELTLLANEVPLFLKMITNFGYAGLIVVGPPPPPKDDLHILDLAKRSGKLSAISMPALTRLKLWHVQNAIIHEMCDKYNAKYLVNAKPELCDPMGFTQAQYVKDAVHVDHHFSKVMIDMLSECILSLSKA
ncbi:hypothetical protein [Roseibium sediminicola]|uniref:SGNH/GDSL hydrolase family protein n=1 Tax=Roseibium sediminicola TaxID=2933272 RepID=A0ABT0H4M6_9HYPH|nr:hypothetical protein [Roseibium sp. CAU 1639]MCK7616242.1 hypothetical protein [Roseibium sp. CAU 1639]